MQLILDKRPFDTDSITPMAALKKKINKSKNIKHNPNPTQCSL